jgi:excisionase family DNA binding protein
VTAPAREFPDEPDLSPKEAATLSGVSYWTVLAEIDRGNLRAYRRPGNRLAIRRDDFGVWAYGVPVVPRERDQPAEAPPRRRRRARAGGSVSPLRELEKRRGVA